MCTQNGQNAECATVYTLRTQRVVISRKKAADTGSLLTHFICLALSLLTIKQMEKNCIISRVERPVSRPISSQRLGSSGPYLFVSLQSLREAWPP